MINEKAKYLTITHKDMTRFFITLEESVKFVINSVSNMIGGEIFIPKLYSCKILDLANIMKLNNQKIKYIGIRPGEKIHEVLISDSNQAEIVEFKNYYVVTPSIIFYKKKNYLINQNKEKGKLIKENFKYSSDNNSKKIASLDLKKFVIKNVNPLR